MGFQQLTCRASSNVFTRPTRHVPAAAPGLGLSIARHLVEAHGGKLWAESIEGQGSTFTFSVPLS